MILVVPFTGSSDYFTELSSRFLKLGGLGGHRLLVPSSPESLGDALAFVSQVRSQFVQADILRVPSSHAPIVRLFRDGLIAAANVKPGQQEIPRHPVLWLEPGYLPTKADWADSLQSAFFNSGGGQRILAEWVKRPDMLVGAGASQHTVPGGWEPRGPAVFPAGFISACELIHRINDQSSPWRERLQFTVTQYRVESPTLSSGGDSLLALPAPAAEPAKPKRTAASRPVGVPDLTDLEPVE
jgi:hypothetical protein